jgi:isocitrate dehydrogenase kinase/phosphatase
LAVRVAHVTAEAFVAWRTSFDSVTRRAESRFEARDWLAMQRDAGERIDLYEATLNDALPGVTDLLGDQKRARPIWQQARREYRKLIARRPDAEIAETYFNSLTRRVFHTEGVDANVEFFGSEPVALAPPRSRLRRYEGPRSLAELLAAVVRDCRFQASWSDLSGDLEAAEVELARRLAAVGMGPLPDTLEVLDQTFYRGHGAYVVGRLTSGTASEPFALAVRHRRSGLAIGALLLGSDDLSILFSYTRSSFHVLLPRPREVVDFLQTLLPHRRRSELFSCVGLGKHAKTELYHDLIGHLTANDDRFVTAPGIPGLVMIVFTLPGFDVVFKVIRDRFPSQKRVTRGEVRAKYRMVSRHDRAGRLIHAHEFEHLRFDVGTFDPDLLAELEDQASKNVSVHGRDVVIHHCYVERRVTPLDVYLRRVEPAEAVRAVVDYGTAIKNLAASNVFPGDMLIKNFGVTGQGRVVFYDYDELALLTDCKFRTIPEPEDPSDEFAEGAWFGVGEGDVFPEEFTHFLGVGQELRSAFEERHRDLYTVRFWTEVQNRILAGEIIEIHPYLRSRELSRAAAPT